MGVLSKLFGKKPRLLRAVLGGYLLTLLGGCASSVKDQPGASSFIGKVERRYEASAMPKFSHGPDMGAMGALLNDIAGTPRHYVYTIVDGNNSENQVAAEADHPIGTCVRVWVLRDYPTQWRWDLGKATLEQANGCTAQ